MTLKAGTRLGPYEIVGPLGSGGMGEVYRARDSRLGRDVAIKVLPQQTASSPEDRARFKREAKAISALNHPNICVLHDIGTEGDTDFLVMELVDGETLAQRISRGPLPTTDVLRVGAQIADALDRAHRAGVVHRDLKPGNVMVTKSGAKLMDFGLARSTQVGRGAGDATATTPEAAPRSEEPITGKGTVVGTYQYMAPEQLEGKRVDARSDLWALGCVLYEMATGRRAFEGSTAASVISSILRDEPRVISELAPLTPPAFERVVRQCLAKDPDERWQSAGDLKRELSWITASGSSSAMTPRRRPRMPVRVALAVGLIAAGALGAILLRPAPEPEVVTFEVATPPGVRSVDVPKISPDARTVAFTAIDSSGVSSIWIRPMDSPAARRIEGTERAHTPFWSPDSRWMAYFAEGRLMKVSLDGGPPVLICTSPRGADGTWSARGVILFDGATTDSILMVSASGGSPRAATVGDTSRGEVGACWPYFLPDGRHFLYIAYQASSLDGTLKVGSIDSPKSKVLGPADSRAEFANGHLFSVSHGVLVARPFDPRMNEFRGEPRSIAQGVEGSEGGHARFSVSSNGTLVYHTVSLPGIERMVWLDRRGRRVGDLGPPGYYESPNLSPDGSQLAVTVTDASRQRGQVWIWDVARNVGSRLSLEENRTLAPIWSPDGRKILYGRVRGSGGELVLQDIARAWSDSILLPSARELKDAADWTRDGRWITYMMSGGNQPGNVDIFALPMSPGSAPIPIAATKFTEFHPAISPDGRLLAYASNASGDAEVYLREFPVPRTTLRVSTEPGFQPSWRGDGKELYYLSRDGDLMAAAVADVGRLGVSRPLPLFHSPIAVSGGVRCQYDVTPDGQRFLVVSREGPATQGTTRVVVNWPSLSRGQ